MGIQILGCSRYVFALQVGLYLCRYAARLHVHVRYPWMHVRGNTPVQPAACIPTRMQACSYTCVHLEFCSYANSFLVTATLEPRYAYVPQSLGTAATSANAHGARVPAVEMPLPAQQSASEEYRNTGDLQRGDRFRMHSRIVGLICFAALLGRYRFLIRAPMPVRVP